MIVTNHTVTIATELVSIIVFDHYQDILTRDPYQEDGERLVGQCEISHPVITVSSTVSEFEDLALDGIGSLAEAQPRNIMYQQEKDEPYEPLPCRISRE